MYDISEFIFSLRNIVDLMLIKTFREFLGPNGALGPSDALVIEFTSIKIPFLVSDHQWKIC